ncbi:MAG: hypothetical protein ACE14L_01700 [Terriglobales bacterium]
MLTGELRRERASQVPRSFDLLSVIALKAESLLGYSGLRVRLGVAPAVLTQVLEELGIEPFRDDDVKRYKAKKARAAEHESWREFLHAARVEGLAPGGLIGSFVRASWRRVRLGKFKGEVPAFALSKAIEIKERLPKAEFYVEELVVEKQYDPFLVVRCGREEFYLEVWDERDFEREQA